MTTTNDEAGKGQEQGTQEGGDKPLSPEEQREADDGFAAGFNKVRAGQDTVAGGDATDSAENADAAAKPQDDAAKAKAEADRKRLEAEDERKAADAADREAYDKLPKSARDQLATLGALKGAVDKLAGHIGGINNGMQRLEKAVTHGRAEAAAAGSKAPSETQVQQALSNPDAWAKLREEFPDWAGPVEAELKAIRNEIAASKGSAASTVNVEQIRQQAADEAEERAYIRMKHPDWKATVKTPEFRTWTLEGGPSTDAYQQMKSRQAANPSQRDEIEAQFASQWSRDHPQWWADRGAAMFGNKADDAIKLLDGFSARSKKAEDDAAIRQRREKRLERAVAPKGTGAPGSPGLLSDEAAFERGAQKIIKQRAGAS